jgi:uncharacterized glyoxalase superfamily protein PhnB
MIKIRSVTAEIMVDNMQDSVNFYQEMFDFKIINSTPSSNPYFVLLRNNASELMLYHRDNFSQEIDKFKNIEIGGSVALCLEVENIRSLYGRIKDRVKLIQELYNTDYGSVEFSCEDPNGYVLIFSER